ncbi:hypothetical protein OROGR_018054 [Orobanche gracilis]
MVDPIEYRYKDEESRALATRNLLNHIMEYRMAAGSLPPSERDSVIGEGNRVEEWLLEKSQQQKSLPKNADPLLWSSDITKKAHAIDEYVRKPCSHWKIGVHGLCEGDKEPRLGRWGRIPEARNGVSILPLKL